MGEYLLVTIQVDMHDRLAMALQDDLTKKISETTARGVLIDISGLEMVDSLAVCFPILRACHGSSTLRRLLSECNRP